MARLAALLFAALLLPLPASAAELTAHRAVELRGNLRSKAEASELQAPEAPEAAEAAAD
eukprot:CAMPEP_0195108432 /NCGR_PEP_ID=MMETSP0448-20130528/85128_1 /TAXON_ID=66468 /ORGANISM="Heterocapsa triquestra, Strain CCMP 448" /LENGTH=58 /DNA_ID=CAMNT_0040144959 /DNA_START=1 /DNA_END=174 /DNA_ORIENTATION=+